MTERPLMTVRELAERWRVDVKTLYAAIQAGQLPAIRLGKRVIRISLVVVTSIEQQGRVVSPNGG